MAQKRKMEITVIDENDRKLYSIFTNIASDVSQLYNVAINQQKIAFHDGQKHALEKLNEWIALEQQEGKLVTVAKIYAYLQKELNNSSVPRLQLQEPQSCGASQNVEMQPGVSSSAPFVQGQETRGNAFGSQDVEMGPTFEDRMN